MRVSKTIASLLFCLAAIACASKKSDPNSNPTPINHPPIAAMTDSVTSINPFTVAFKVMATDLDYDKLTYTWDFGDGNLKSLTANEAKNFTQGTVYVVKVSVTDGKSDPVVLTDTVNTTVSTVTIDASQKFQTIDGFGGFGGQDNWFSGGPFTSDNFVNTVINDLGLTILRDDVPSNFELVNDNNDPYVTDLSKFNITQHSNGSEGALIDHLPYLKAMNAAGLNKMIATVFTPMPWMKWNNQVGNGTQNVTSAPPYTDTPDSTTNQLKPSNYEEFAEMCEAYITIIKQQTNIDVYAISLQNEPLFSQYYMSCVYNGNALRDLVKVVGKRFRDDGYKTKIFLPEGVGYFDGVDTFVQPVLADPVALSYVDIFATHGYAFDGITAGSADAQTWQKMANWGAPSGKPLWMTETSGFSNDQTGAMNLGKAMYTALKFGNISAWLHWTLSSSTLDSFSLMSSSGVKSKRYFVSKNFYRYIRPGAYRINATAPVNSGIYALSFVNTTENTKTIILINDNTGANLVKVSGNVSSQYEMYTTSTADDCKDLGVINSTDAVLLPGKSVTTLYQK